MSDAKVRLENWRLLESSTSKTIVANPGFQLSGNAYGHPSYNDGDIITTSEIVNVEGRQVFSASRTYYLGEPAIGFKEMVKDLGVNFDPENPLGPYMVVRYF